MISKDAPQTHPRLQFISSAAIFLTIGVLGLLMVVGLIFSSWLHTFPQSPGGDFPELFIAIFMLLLFMGVAMPYAVAAILLSVAIVAVQVLYLRRVRPSGLRKAVVIGSLSVAALVLVGTVVVMVYGRQ